MSWVKPLSLLFLLLSSQALHAQEVDNFTTRATDKQLPDDSVVIGQYIDDQIQQALNAYSEHLKRVKESPHCDKRTLQNYLEYSLDMNWSNVTVRVVKSSEDDVPRGGTPTTKGGIYDFNKPTLVKLGPLMLAKACCARVLNINGHLIGTDKVSHLLGHGFTLYRDVQQTGSLENALALGNEEEGGIWGLGGTGVKSYGDMSANYGGYLFWKDLLDSKDSYIQCGSDGVLRQVTKVDVKRYVDDAWDEAINCSSFSRPDIAQKIVTNIKRVSNGMDCPVEPDKCTDLIKSGKYPPEIAQYIIHPNCRNLAAARIAYETANECGPAGNELLDYLSITKKDLGNIDTVYLEQHFPWLPSKK